MRPMAIAFVVMFLCLPGMVSGQTSVGEPGRVSVQAGAGATVMYPGNALSATFGYSPASRLDLLLNVERIHVPSQFRHYPHGTSATRGGTLTFLSPELRLSLFPADRVSPFATIGVGRGVSHPNVNAQFPVPVKNDLRVVYFGGGIRVPLRQGLSLVGDVRAMLALEGYDGIMGVWPVRAGVAWRF